MTSTLRDTTTSNPAALVALVAASGTLASLAGLHVLSPEFAPHGRMVSEYALGGHSWLLTVMFGLWALSSWALAAALWPYATTTASKIGIGFLVAAGVGEAMAALFDIKHPLHGVSAMIGTPSLVIAALLLSYGLVRLPGWSDSRAALLATAHATWITFVLMAVCVGIMFATIGPDATPENPGPDAILVQGYANRLLVVAYCVWAIVAAAVAHRVRET
jgi:hypothetical protein